MQHIVILGDCNRLLWALAPFVLVRENTYDRSLHLFSARTHAMGLSCYVASHVRVCVLDSLGFANVFVVAVVAVQ